MGANDVDDTYDKQQQQEEIMLSFRTSQSNNAQKRPRTLPIRRRNAPSVSRSSISTGQLPVMRRPNFKKVTRWMTPDELVPLLVEGDMVEFDRHYYQHWGVFVQCNIAPLTPASPSSVAVVDDANAYIVHLSGGKDGEQFASTREEPDEIDAYKTPTQEKPSPDMTVTSGHRSDQSSLQLATGNIKRSESIRSMFATSLGSSQMAEVRCDTLHDIASGCLVRINNSKDHHFTPMHCEEVVGRAISELGRQQYHLLFTNCEHFASWCRYGSKSSYQATLVKTMAASTVAGLVVGSASVSVAVGIAMLTACRLGDAWRHKRARLTDRIISWCNLI